MLSSRSCARRTALRAVGKACPLNSSPRPLSGRVEQALTHQRHDLAAVAAASAAQIRQREDDVLVDDKTFCRAVIKISHGLQASWVARWLQSEKARESAALDSFAGSDADGGSPHRQAQQARALRVLAGVVQNACTLNAARTVDSDRRPDSSHAFCALPLQALK